MPGSHRPRTRRRTARVGRVATPAPHRHRETSPRGNKGAPSHKHQQARARERCSPSTRSRASPTKQETSLDRLLQPESTEAWECQADDGGLRPRPARLSGNSALLDGPSPAEYVVKDDRMCSNVPIQAASGPMRSKTAGRQDKRRIEDTPGPGAYRRMDVDFKRRPPAPPPPPAVSWERVPTAPSIPGHHQSFGYEEGPDGELVQQMRVDEGYDGTKMSMPGPSDYRPRHVKGAHVPKADLARTSGHSTFERPVEIVPPFNPYEHPKPTSTSKGRILPGRATANPEKCRVRVGRRSEFYRWGPGAGLKKPLSGPGSDEIAASDLPGAREKRTYFSHGGSRFDNSFSGGRYTSPGPASTSARPTHLNNEQDVDRGTLGPARTGSGVGADTDWTRGSTGPVPAPTSRPMV